MNNLKRQNSYRKEPTQRTKKFSLRQKKKRTKKLKYFFLQSDKWITKLYFGKASLVWIYLVKHLMENRLNTKNCHLAAHEPVLFHVDVCCRCVLNVTNVCKDNSKKISVWSAITTIFTCFGFCWQLRVKICARWHFKTEKKWNFVHSVNKNRIESQAIFDLDRSKTSLN